jgi:hypothetical protein
MWYYLHDHMFISCMAWCHSTVYDNIKFSTIENNNSAPNWLPELILTKILAKIL